MARPFCNTYTMNMKRLSPALPSLVSAKRLLIVSRLSVRTLCTLLKSHQCFHQRDILKRCTLWNLEKLKHSHIKLSHWTYSRNTSWNVNLFCRPIACNRGNYVMLVLSAVVSPERWWGEQLKTQLSPRMCLSRLQHLIYIASIIKNGISLIISASECSINHKGPLNHAADGDDDKLMLWNYAKRHTSWSGFKVKAHKPCSCFICLPSVSACTLKASFSSCAPKLKTMPRFFVFFYKGSLCFQQKKEIRQDVENLNSKSQKKVYISGWCALEAFKHPALSEGYTHLSSPLLLTHRPQIHTRFDICSWL